MKSWLKYILTIAAALSCTTLLTTSCLQSDFDEPLLAGDTAKVSFSLGLDDEITTRAGEGNSIDQLLVAVYNNSTGELVGANNTEAQIVNGNQIKGNFTVELLVGQEYKAVFFAHHDGAYTFSEDYKTISIATYNVDNPEYLDAFYGTKTFSVVASKNTISHELKRPFGLLVFGVKEDNFMENSTAEIKLDGVPTSFNALDGEVSTSTTTQTLNFTPDSTIKVGDNYQGYVLLGMAYVLPSKVTPTLTLSVGGVPQDAKTLNLIDIVANKRYNLLGNSLFVVDNWGGVVTMSGLPEENVSSDGWIHIKTAHELAYVLEKGDDVKIEKQSASLSSTRAEEAKPELIDVTNPRYHICNDIDISKWATQTSTARFTENVVICGGNWGENTTPTVGKTPTNDDKKYFTVKGLNMTANGIFGDVENFTLQNFLVEGCTMTAPESNPVGMIAGTVTGSLTLTNVFINGGEVKGSSKVGGLIGYIESSTNSVATLTYCASSAIITATATDYAGALVGCFKGNDASETLNFISCFHSSNSTFNTSFCEAEQACFNVYDEVTETGVHFESNEEHLLGGEELCRGTINYGIINYDPVRFFYRWDGKRTVTPLTVNGSTAIYSPYDLADCQGKAITSMTFYQDVDMGGTDEELEWDGNKIRTEVGVDFKRQFRPISSVRNLNGNNKTIHNLRVQMIHDGYGAGFIQNINGGTVKDLTINKAYIFNDNDWSLNIPVYPTVRTDVTDYNGKSSDKKGQGNAYAGTLATTVSGTATVSNVHITNGKVFAICKMGGLVGRVSGDSGTATIENCSVNGCTIQNYQANVPNYYTLPTEYNVAGFDINLLQWWYTQGEVGGLIGFIQHIKANINSCSVTDTYINAFGQIDKTVTANVWNNLNNQNHFQKNKSVVARGDTIIAGRHVNQFIGEVVSQRSEDRASSEDYTVTIKDYVVSNNSYGKEYHRHEYQSKTYCDVVGCAYYVGVDVKIASLLEKHIQYCAGKLIFNPKDGDSVTITEPIWSGNNQDWMGGNFTNISTTILIWSPKSIYPDAPSTIIPVEGYSKTDPRSGK